MNVLCGTYDKGNSVVRRTASFLPVVLAVVLAVFAHQTNNTYWQTHTYSLTHTNTHRRTHT